MKRIILTFFCVLATILSYSQDVEMADGLRSEGKIYVVVGVLVTIFAGIILYLILIDRKVSDMEKKLKK